MSDARGTNGARRAVVLLSGGLDSATALAVARRDGFQCHALSFEYGQRHAVELQSAKRIATALGAVSHTVVPVGLDVFGGSALTSDDIAVPKDSTSTGIPVTYVPARNTVFLSLALAHAEVVEAWDIFIGVNVLDYSGYPDCRPDYIAAFEKMAAFATKAAVEGRGRLRVQTPLIRMTKAEIITLGTSLGVDYALTVSCYDPGSDGSACAHCDACALRARGFAEAGLRDPARSRAPSRA